MSQRLNIHLQWSMTLILLMFAFCVPTIAESVGASGQPDMNSDQRVLRFGFSGKVFADVNEADAMAAVKMWAEHFYSSDERGALVECRIFANPDALERALVEEQVDMINITTEEFRSLRPHLDTERIFLSVFGDDFRVDYLLLVNADHPARGLGDLKGASLLVLDNLQTSIAPYWLSSQLRGMGLPPAEEHFGSISRFSKASRIILPVFFGKVDACLVSRRAYETAIELNPQLGNSLRIVCSSPRLIPGACCFRASFQETEKDRICSIVRDMHTLSSSEQVLMLFKTSRIDLATEDALESTLRVIESGDAGLDP